ncbi:unnamed protein product, partial [Brassica rapa]
MDVLCVLTDTHGHTHRHTRTATDVLCVLTDSHGQPRTSCVCWRTPTDVLCLMNRQPPWAKITQTVLGKGHHAEQPTWAKITRTVHGKGQSAESNDQRADMCTDGQTQTSYVMCVLMDSQGRPVCADGHPRTQPTWAKITRTVHGKGQRADIFHVRASVLSPRTNVLICTHTDVLCVLTDTDGRPVCADGHPLIATNPRMSCVCWRTPTDVLCVLNRQPTWAKITQRVHRKG